VPPGHEARLDVAKLEPIQGQHVFLVFLLMIKAGLWFISWKIRPLHREVQNVYQLNKKIKKNKKEKKGVKDTKEEIFANGGKYCQKRCVKSK
jgi:hypothetical protein